VAFGSQRGFDFVTSASPELLPPQIREVFAPFFHVRHRFVAKVERHAATIPAIQVLSLDEVRACGDQLNFAVLTPRSSIPRST
jgi:hypothetical protein